MRHLIIRNFGALNQVDIDIDKINIIIGMQSSGKSCVLKTACHCSWVEKRLELSQKNKEFAQGSSFIDMMLDYYSMHNYIHENTYIEYETAFMKFSYDHSKQLFDMHWKRSRWNYKRPKVSYVPAERNLVAAIPEWSSVSMDGNMVEFMGNWNKARKFLKKEENFLNLGMTYSYDSLTNTDNIRLKNDRLLTFKESSSGIQSLLPMFIHLDYLTKGQYEETKVEDSYEQREERKYLLTTIYKNLNKKNKGQPIKTISLEKMNFPFSNIETATKFQEIYGRYIRVDHSEIFLEEPEENLFPPTLCQFADWMLDAGEEHHDLFFIATHSPYFLNQIIKRNPKGITVLFTHLVKNQKDSLYNVRQLTKEEIREIYDNGVDMFFNFELYT
ncbi:ATP-binding protein [Prevotella nigrescens]